MIIEAAAISAFLKKWWIVLAAAALFGTLLSLAYCKGQSAGKSKEVVAQQKREIQTQRDLGKANENAADQRVKDAVKTEQQKRELNDALEATQDPDRQRALRGCIILRQQGRDTSHIPACGRPPAG